MIPDVKKSDDANQLPACAICYESLTAPFACLAQCQHTYCHSCFQKIWDSIDTLQEKLQFCCPTCRTEIKFGDWILSGEYVAHDSNKKTELASSRKTQYNNTITHLQTLGVKVDTSRARGMLSIGVLCDLEQNRTYRNEVRQKCLAERDIPRTSEIHRFLCKRVSSKYALYFCEHIDRCINQYMHIKQMKQEIYGKTKLLVKYLNDWNILFTGVCQVPVEGHNIHDCGLLHERYIDIEKMATEIINQTNEIYKKIEELSDAKASCYAILERLEYPL